LGGAEIKPEPTATKESVEEAESIDREKLRREWRINPDTGDLRGVYYVRPGKERTPVYYIGRRENPEEFWKIYPEFLEWKSKKDALR